MTNPFSLGSFKYIDVRQFEESYGTVIIFPSVARVFTDSFPSWLDDVQAGVDLQDVKLLTDRLHKMKGCCLMMGAYGLSQELETLEKQIALCGISQSRRLLNEVVHKIKEMDSELARVARS